MRAYRVQSGCHSCARCFKREQWDEASTLYCTFKAPSRPLCMSVAMEESPKLDKDKRYKAHRKWEKWAVNREVHPSGICENFYEREIKDERRKRRKGSESKAQR